MPGGNVKTETQAARHYILAGCVKPANFAQTQTSEIKLPFQFLNGTKFFVMSARWG